MSVLKTHFKHYQWYDAQRITSKIRQMKCQYTKYKTQHNYAKAIECLETLMAIGPYSDELFNEKLKEKWCNCQCMIANEYWKEGKFDESIIHWSKVIEKDMTFGASPYYYIGLYHWFNNRPIKAEYYLQKAVTLKPDIINYKLHLKVIKNEINSHQQQQMLQTTTTANLIEMNEKEICIRINLCFLFETGLTIIQAWRYITNLGYKIDILTVPQIITKGSAYWCNLYANKKTDDE